MYELINVDLPEENVPNTDTIGHHGTWVANDSSRLERPREWATWSKMRKLLTASSNTGFSAFKCCSSFDKRTPNGEVSSVLMGLTFLIYRQMIQHVGLVLMRWALSADARAAVHSRRRARISHRVVPCAARSLNHGQRLGAARRSPAAGQATENRATVELMVPRLVACPMAGASSGFLRQSYGRYRHPPVHRFAHVIDCQ